MTTSHLGLMILFAACVSIVFGTLMRDDTAAQRQFIGRAFAGLVVGACAVGWLMYWVFP